MNSHIVKPDDNKPFHSNGYAEIANANQIGSTSSLTFERRQSIESNRQVIGSYKRSSIGTTYSVMRAKPVAEKAMSRNIIRQRSALPQRNMSPTTRRFSEPSGRTFNPYA